MQKHLKMIQELVDNIEENVGYDVNIITLANSFEVSPWHFQRLFKSIVGDSLGGYVRGRRLSIGAKLLLSTKSSIINIAFEVGFNSHESFTRSFKSYFNFSPKQFRKVRPPVLIHEKPFLNEELLEHITEGMDAEPIIVDKNEQIIIGFDTDVPSPFNNLEPICDLVYAQWMTLLRRQEEIQDTTKHTFVGLNVSPSGTFTEETIRYIAGIPVLSDTAIPKGMTSITLPKQKVAIFDTKANIEAEALKRTIDYIYGYWLPNSDYKRGVGNDYELFEDVYDFMTGNFSSKYVIPIVDK